MIEVQQIQVRHVIQIENSLSLGHTTLFTKTSDKNTLIFFQMSNELINV